MLDGRDRAIAELAAEMVIEATKTIEAERNRLRGALENLAGAADGIRVMLIEGECYEGERANRMDVLASTLTDANVALHPNESEAWGEEDKQTLDLLRKIGIAKDLTGEESEADDGE